MTNFINKTEKNAYKHFVSYGFEKENIFKLMKVAMKDVRSGLETLELCIKEADSMDLEVVHNTLHGLKGLLSQLGNIQIIAELERLEQSTNTGTLIKELRLLFFY